MLAEEQQAMVCTCILHKYTNNHVHRALQETRKREREKREKRKEEKNS